MIFLDTVFNTVRAKLIEMNKTSSVPICPGEFVIPSEEEGC
jgi:hypothetical protein